MNAPNWTGVLRATYRTRIDQSEGEAWDWFIQREIPEVGNDEIAESIYEAFAHKEEPEFTMRGVCCGDVVRWVKEHRRGWRGQFYVIDDKIYFPGKGEGTAKILTKKATAEDVRIAKKLGLYAKTKEEVYKLKIH